ncbi:sulfurtransferase [Nocardioides caldifontis]|uniref:sulfurtransferase n=1 Tax=Nocardioides caldifontis TaxID=2588938 RepID=UPI0011DFF7D8|nr:sulfurtransferase [Nocardioides caldifontis]
MSPLIGVPELARALGSVTVLDVRWQLGRSDGRAQHEAGHVPGAVYVDLDTVLADPAGAGGRHPLPEPGRFAEEMRRCGVDRDRPVVVYDDVGGTSAARCWWLLRFHGHPDVRVLDGGWSAWRAAGSPVEAGPVTPERGSFDADPGHLPVVDADGAARIAGDGVLVDARAPERYRGEVEPVDPVAGHVPGAVNVPTAANLGQDGRFRTVEELREVYAAALASDEVAVYCGSGVTAAHDVLALELLGVRAALYAGSWSEWVTDPERPVATG